MSLQLALLGVEQRHSKPKGLKESVQGVIAYRLEIEKPSAACQIAMITSQD
jgi:hypothetical protein